MQIWILNIPTEKNVSMNLNILQKCRKVEGVIGTSFYYKGFSASINLRYRLGGQIFMQTLYDKVENLSSSKKWENLDKRALYDRWKQPGDQAKFKSIASSEVTPISSRFVEDNNVLSGE